MLSMLGTVETPRFATPILENKKQLFFCVVIEICIELIKKCLINSAQKFYVCRFPTWKVKRLKSEAADLITF